MATARDDSTKHRRTGFKSMKDRPITVIRAGAIRDAGGRAVRARPGAVALAGGRILAAGRDDDMPAHPDRVIDLRNRLVMPAFVNAHAHLDLTDLGPLPYTGDFTAWLANVARARPADDTALAAAVRHGIRQSRDAGVGCVGDIAHHPAAIRARQHQQMPGVSYLELLGIGATQADRIEQARQRLEGLRFDAPAAGGHERAVVGLSPHSPYTAGPDIFDWADRMSEDHAYRLCTHAAESRDEIAFLRDGSGPVADHLRRFGLSDADIASMVTGQHPIDLLDHAMRRGRWMLVHCNYLDDDHIRLIRRRGATVAYCPIASEYFGHTGHRYRDLLDAGVPVALGTDSVVCQPPSEPQPLGILPQMRRLYRRDGADPPTLLAMATVHGMQALQLPDRLATLERDAPALFTTVPFDLDEHAEPLTQALRDDQPAALLDLTDA